jgi:hypothetical protein
MLYFRLLCDTLYVMLNRHKQPIQLIQFDEDCEFN